MLLFSTAILPGHYDMASFFLNPLFDSSFCFSRSLLIFPLPMWFWGGWWRRDWSWCECDQGTWINMSGQLLRGQSPVFPSSSLGYSLSFSWFISHLKFMICSLSFRSKHTFTRMNGLTHCLRQAIKFKKLDRVTPGYTYSLNETKAKDIISADSKVWVSIFLFGLFHPSDISCALSLPHSFFLSRRSSISHSAIFVGCTQSWDSIRQTSIPRWIAWTLHSSGFFFLEGYVVTHDHSPLIQLARYVISFFNFFLFCFVSGLLLFSNFGTRGVNLLPSITRQGRCLSS
jgi:hypothetical protein